VAVRAVDLFLASALGEQEAQGYLRTRGFRDPVAADRHLRAMAADPVVRQALGALADTLIDALSRAPDPDQALVGLSRYLGVRTAPRLFLEYLHEDPGALRALVDILGTSVYLTDILVRNPEYFHVMRAEVDRPRPVFLEPETDEEARGVAAPVRSALNALKRLKRQRMLGIAARDLLGRDELPAVGHQLAALAGTLVDRALAIVVRERLNVEGRREMPGAFAVVGMGKLGGDELNYSSDIDVIYVYEPAAEDDNASHDFFHRVARKLTAALTDHTDESYLYRVDLRLRPMGRSGAIAHSLDQLRRYYDAAGETFERFALIKARPVAGDVPLGDRFVEMVQPFVYRKYLDYAALEELYQYKARSDRRIEGSMRDRNVKL
jgi:glutamate-ammonia-ligase adenylyltransferase